MYGGVQVRAPIAGAFPRSRKTFRARVKRATREAHKGGIRSIILSLPLFLLGLVLMAGEEWSLGQNKVRPGTFTRIVNESPTTPGATNGIVAVLFRSDWGPTGSVQEIADERQISELYGAGGAGGTTGVLREVFRGRASEVLALRLGTGGTKATIVLDDGAAADAVTLTAKYEGVRANGWTVTKRATLADATKNEVITHEGSVILETITYSPGADDATALVAAIEDPVLGSRYWDAELDAAGDVAAVAQSAVAGGVAPTINGAAVTEALGLLETEPFGVLVTDLEDSASHAQIDAWVDRVRSEGKRVMAVVGEPTTVAIATRRANATALNNAAIVYVLNGFVTTDGTQEGRYAAARVAGMIGAARLTDSLTNQTVEGATDLVGALTGSEYVSAIQAGALTFSRNARRRVAVEYGITSLVTPAPNQDLGWKKIRRVRTRDALIDQIVRDTEELRGRINNDKTGRDLLIARMQGAINGFIRDGALSGGTVMIDEQNPPQGDTAYFVIAVDDNDSIEKVFLTFGFRFTQPVAA